MVLFYLLSKHSFSKPVHRPRLNLQGRACYTRFQGSGTSLEAECCRTNNPSRTVHRQEGIHPICRKQCIWRESFCCWFDHGAEAICHGLSPSHTGHAKQLDLSEEKVGLTIIYDCWMLTKNLCCTKGGQLGPPSQPTKFITSPMIRLRIRWFQGALKGGHKGVSGSKVVPIWVLSSSTGIQAFVLYIGWKSSFHKFS